MAKTTPEGKVKTAIKAVLDALMAAGKPVWYYMPVPGRLSRPGIPDFVCCVNGLFLGIEAKAGKGTTTLAQDIVIMKITHAMGTALVVNETPESQKNLRALLADTLETR